MDVEKIAADRYRVRAHNQIITLSAHDLLELQTYAEVYRAELEQEAKAAMRAEARAKNWPVDSELFPPRTVHRANPAKAIEDTLRTIEASTQKGHTRMAEFNHEQAIKRYTELSKLIHVGAAGERDHEGNYHEDGIERAADELEHQAALQGLQFVWDSEAKVYTLEPMSAEDIAAFKAAQESK
jgi:hypothetical protein